MKSSQFSTEQIIKILEQAERGEQPISAIGRADAIAETTFYRWRKQFGGMSVNEVQRLRELEKEHARLKRLLAQRDLEVDGLTELLAKKG
jgi:putative transposase